MLTSPQLLLTCEQVLINEQADKLKTHFPVLLQSRREEELKGLYILMKRASLALEPFQKMFEKHVKQLGEAAISSVVGKSRINSESIKSGDYVRTLVEVYRWALHMAQTCFDNNSGFLSALNRACKSFFNKIVFLGSSTIKSSAFLAKHVDTLLRKNTKGIEEGGLEDALEQAASVISFSINLYADLD